MTEKSTRFADKLARLFDTVRDPDGHLYTVGQVATAITNDPSNNVTVSRSYLSQLRSGAKTGSPSAALVAALAHFFGVPVDYFSDSDLSDRIDSQLEQLAALRDSGAQRLLLRVHGISQDSLDAVIKMAESARQIEGLPPITDE